MRKGSAAIAVVITGDDCPCMSNNRNNYSAQWHADNPLADDCNKTGKLDTTSTTTNIKAMFTDGTQALGSLLNKEQISVIGEIQKGEQIMFGQCNTSGVFFDISGFVERRDYITYDGINYIVRDYFDINYMNDVGQVSILRKIEA